MKKKLGPEEPTAEAMFDSFFNEGKVRTLKGTEALLRRFQARKPSELSQRQQNPSSLPLRPSSSSCRPDSGGSRPAVPLVGTRPEGGPSKSGALRDRSVVQSAFRLVRVGLASLLLLLVLGFSYLSYRHYNYGPILFWLSAKVHGQPTESCLDLPPEVWHRIPACVAPSE